MSSGPTDTPIVGDPFARLELNLIDDFIRARGHDPDAIRSRTDRDARTLLAEASTYAATKLGEVEARAHYVHDIHDNHV